MTGNCPAGITLPADTNLPWRNPIWRIWESYCEALSSQLCWTSCHYRDNHWACSGLGFQYYRRTVRPDARQGDGGRDHRLARQPRVPVRGQPHLAERLPVQVRREGTDHDRNLEHADRQPVVPRRGLHVRVAQVAQPTVGCPGAAPRDSRRGAAIAGSPAPGQAQPVTTTTLSAARLASM